MGGVGLALVATAVPARRPAGTMAPWIGDRPAGPGACAPLACDGIDVVPVPACDGHVELSAMVTGGVAPFTLQWDVNDDGLVDAVGARVGVRLPAGATNVKVDVKDSCTAPASQTCSVARLVNVPSALAPVIVASGPTDFCEVNGESVTLDAGAGRASYEWLRDGVPVAGGNTQSISVTEAGRYAVRIVDVGGCVAESLPVFVNATACGCATVPACVSVHLAPAEACAGDVVVATLDFSGGGPPFDFIWDVDGDGSWDFGHRSNPISLVAVEGALVITGRVSVLSCPPFPNGWECVAPLVVRGLAPPAVTPDGPLAFCAGLGERVTLVADAGLASYSWLENGIELLDETQDRLTVARSGSFAVEVTDGNGCRSMSAPSAVDAGSCPACPGLTCAGMLAERGPTCDPLLYTFTADVAGGYLPLAIGWDFDADTLADVQGSPGQWRLQPGVQSVELLVSDSCPAPGSATCSLVELVDVADVVAPPGEVSNVPAGEAPLLVEDRGRWLSFECDPMATAFNVHVGGIGTWDRPGIASACHRTDWIAEPSGTTTLEVDLPSQSWILVTASGPCSEGPAGVTSLLVERSDAPGWTRCGGFP